MIKPTESNTFCWYPFFQMAMKVFRQDGGLSEVAPCCNSIRPPFDDPMGLNDSVDGKTPVEIFNSPQFQKLREDLLNGRKHPACNTCWRIEEEGRNSYRHNSRPNHLTEQQLEDLVENPTLRGIDTTSSLKCNLRCRMCNPIASTKLAVDQQAFRDNGTLDEVSELVKFDWSFEPTTVDFRKENTQLQWLRENPDQLYMFKVSGGEPMYDADFIDFLHDYTSNGENQTSLLMHTNATQFNRRAMGIINKFHRVDLTFSIDSFGRNYEYIRYPMTWDGLQKSIHNFLTHITVPYTVDVNCVVQSSNLLEVHRLAEWANSNGFSMQFSDLDPPGRAGDPKFLPINVLEEAKRRLEAVQLEDPWKVRVPKLLQDIQFWIDNNKADENSRRRMLREFQLFDKVRDQSYKDYLDPLLVEYLNASE